MPTSGGVCTPKGNLHRTPQEGRIASNQLVATRNAPTQAHSKIQICYIMNSQRRWSYVAPWATAILLCWRICEQVVHAEQMVANTYIRLDLAQASSVFPSVGQGGEREFSAERALSRGSGYWCSEGNHRKNDVVSWTGQLKTRRMVEGIEMHWAYAPGKGRIFESICEHKPNQTITFRSWHRR